MGDHPRIEFLQAWRIHRKLSQEALAALVGLTQGMISQLENGDTEFLGRHLVDFARVLRCSTFDLQFRHPEGDDDPVAIALRLPKNQRPLAARLLKQLPKN